MGIFVVAEALGKHAHDIAQLPPDELAHWFAYFSIKHDREEKAYAKAKAEAEAKRKSAPASRKPRRR